MRKNNQLRISIQKVFRISRKGSNKRLSGDNKMGTVYFRLMCQNHKPIEISTRIIVARKMWDCEKGLVKGRSEETRILNEKLKLFKRELDGIEVELRNSGKSFTISTIKDFLTGENEKRHDLLSMFMEMMDMQAFKLSKTTNRHYKTSYNYLKEYIGQKYSATVFAVSNADYDFIEGFDRWLRVEKGCKDGGASKHHGRLQKFLDKQTKKRTIAFNPYVQFEINRPESKPRFLSVDELIAIERLNLNSGSKLKKVRDGFLFCCYTGLSFSDFRRLTRSHITKINEGQVIVDKRSKSGIGFAIKLMKPATRLLEEYVNDVEVVLSDCLIPSIENQPTNRYLKEIQKLCGIKKNLTFHVSRHTFATTVILNSGGTVDNLKKMLGHSDIKTTQIYAKIFDNSAIQEMDQIDKNLSTYN